MAPIYGKYIIPKDSINTQKLTNAPNLISQSEPIIVKGNNGGQKSAN